MHKRVKELIEEPLKSINIKLDDVEYVKEGSMYFLRVIIDKEPYVDVDTCVKATEIINPILDKIENEWLRKQYEEALNGVYCAIGNEIPATLTLEQQAYFALGYRQMCTKLQKDKNERIEKIKNNVKDQNI